MSRLAAVSVFDPENGCHQILDRGQFALGVGVLIDQQIFELRFELPDQSRHRRYQFEDIGYRRPTLAPVVAGSTRRIQMSGEARPTDYFPIEGEIE